MTPATAAPAAAPAARPSGSEVPSATPARPGGYARRRRPRRVTVLLLDDAFEHETIPVARDRADVARLARVVAERAAQGAHGLAERAVGHDHVGPDAVEYQPAADASLRRSTSSSSRSK